MSDLFNKNIPNCNFKGDIEDLKFRMPKSEIEVKISFELDGNLDEDIKNILSSDDICHTKQLLESNSDIKTESSFERYKNLYLDCNDEECIKFYENYEYPLRKYILETYKNNSDVEKTKQENLIIKELEEFMSAFKIKGQITECKISPLTTLIAVKLPLGTKINVFDTLKKELMMHFFAKDVEILKPIPNRKEIGILLHNNAIHNFEMFELLKKCFSSGANNTEIPLGVDNLGNIISIDLTKTKHILVGGTTGSGKSNLLRNIILSLICNNKPNRLKISMVDAKGLEFNCFENNLCNLDQPGSFKEKSFIQIYSLYRYMIERLEIISSFNCADYFEYSNLKIKSDRYINLPLVVVIVDEIISLFTDDAKYLEQNLIDLSKDGYKAGIIMIISTNRPDYKVLSGKIKSNINSRIAFRTTSNIDSRIILEEGGAEKLQYVGEMLYKDSNNSTIDIYTPKFPIDMLSDHFEFDTIIRKEFNEIYLKKAENINKLELGELDELFYEAGKLVIEHQNASIGMLQRRFGMGFNRAAKIIEQLETEGVISSQDSKMQREVIISIEDFEIKFGYLK